MRDRGANAAIGAAILLFAKKLWLLIIAIPAAILASAKKFFRRDKTAE